MCLLKCGVSAWPLGPFPFNKLKWNIITGLLEYWTGRAICLLFVCVCLYVGTFKEMNIWMIWPMLHAGQLKKFVTRQSPWSCKLFDATSSKEYFVAVVGDKLVPYLVQVARHLLVHRSVCLITAVYLFTARWNGDAYSASWWNASITDLLHRTSCYVPRDNERKARREIANSNERRRMQSINAGFQALRKMLQPRDGDKLSKVSLYIAFQFLRRLTSARLNCSLNVIH